MTPAAGSTTTFQGRRTPEKPRSEVVDLKDKDTMPIAKGNSYGG